MQVTVSTEVNTTEQSVVPDPDSDLSIPTFSETATDVRTFSKSFFFLVSVI